MCIRDSPNSPDLNPVDYKIWGIMQQRVYEMQIHNVGKLKRFVGLTPPLR